MNATMTTDTTNRIQPGTLLKAKEVKTALSCGIAQVWVLARKGQLNPVRFGTRMTRFRSDEVLALMEHGI